MGTLTKVIRWSDYDLIVPASLSARQHTSITMATDELERANAIVNVVGELLGHEQRGAAIQLILQRYSDSQRRKIAMRGLLTTVLNSYPDTDVRLPTLDVGPVGGIL